MKALLSSVCVASVLYSLLVGLAFVNYKRLLYPAPAEGPLLLPPHAVLVERATPGGVPFHGVYFAPRPTMPTFLLFHGNGETAQASLPRARDLAARGFGVLIAEYRGYGLSSTSGTPGEAGLYDDAAAALAFLSEAGVATSSVVVWGTSLGTGVASELAANGCAGKLVLVTPYTSILDVAAYHAWFLPVRWIVEEKLNTLAKAPRIHVPTLVIHGDADEVVPFTMGRVVANAIAGATFIRVPGGHHNDLYARDPTLLDRIMAFARPPMASVP